MMLAMMLAMLMADNTNWGKNGEAIENFQLKAIGREGTVRQNGILKWG